MRYVIVGSSHAAVGCVEAIRERDPQGEIVLFSKEGHRPYSRPLISYYLQGKTDRERMLLRGGDFFERMNVRAHLGCAVAAIDAAGHYVLDETGEKTPYDKLLIATGSVPFVPPMEGLEKVQNKQGFLTLDDALELEGRLNPQSRVLIIGAGLIGMKCAEGIAHRVQQVDVVEMAPRVLPAVLDTEAAALVQARMEKENIRFHLGTSAERFDAAEALLKNGEKIPFDLLVLAVGVRPNTALLEQAGAAVQRGVQVDEGMRTTLKDVYAAGDVALSHDSTDDDKEKVLAILPNAYLQGRVAGLNMAGGQDRLPEVFPMNAGGFFDLHMISAGSTRGEEIRVEQETGLKKLYVRDDKLVGFLMLGDVERAGIYTALIRDKTPLHSIDFALIAKAPQLMAFSGQERARKLGGKAI